MSIFLIIPCDGFFVSHPLEGGCPPKWAYEWGDSNSTGPFVGSKSCKFFWLNLRGAELPYAGIWWCEVSELPSHEEMELIGARVADPFMANLIRTTRVYEAWGNQLRLNAERQRKSEADEAALRADMAANPEKYVKALEEAEKWEQEMMKQSGQGQEGEQNK